MTLRVLSKTGIATASLFAFACSSENPSGDVLERASEAAEADDGHAFRIESSAFDDGEPIPDDHTCNGKPFGSGFSPKLKWKNAPAGTKSFAIVFEDLSLTHKTPIDNRGFHWVMWDIPENLKHLNEALGSEEFPDKPRSARQWSRYSPFGYLGPCPNFDPNVPVRTDTYAFIVYALDREIIAFPPVNPAVPNYTRVMSEYLETIAIAKASLVGTSEAIPSAPPVPPGPPPVPSPRP